jgi:hypothetical protein
LPKLHETLAGPSTGYPFGGLARFCTNRAMLRRVSRVFAVIATGASVASAQVITGTIRSQETERTVPGARITVADSLGKLIGEVTTDALGKFRITLPSAVPFTVLVRKVGWKPSSTDLIRPTPNDTLEVNLLVPGEPADVDAVRITAQNNATSNARSLEEAKRRGWKLVPPEAVERHRETSMNFDDMLRATGAQGLILPSRPEECIRSNRTRRCLVYVIDGVPAGISLYVNPRDVLFFSVLSATESAVIWGDKAPFGAIVIVTRAYGDKKPG